MKHTIKLIEVRTTTRSVTVDTNDEFPDLDSIIKLVAEGVNNVGFDEIGDEEGDERYQTINGIDVDFIEI
jgi:hypothetical protein